MFNLASAPFAHNRKQTQTLMLLVILACLPGFLAQTWFFGWGTLIQTLLALVTALGCEALVLRLRGRPVKPALLDGSAALTAVLIGLSLPPLLPWWMLVLGTAYPQGRNGYIGATVESVLNRAPCSLMIAKPILQPH